MNGRKRNKIKKEDEEEEDGLHKNKSLLEYQNKSLCTVILDLRSKLKSKENSYNLLETKLNSLISYFNIFSSTINSLNDRIISSLKKNKIEITNVNISKDKNFFSSPSEFIHKLLEKDNSGKDDDSMQVEEEEESKKDEKKISKDFDNEKEYKPIISLNKNVEILIEKLLSILKLNDGQYEKIFSNLDEEIDKKNQEQEKIINDLNTSLNKYKSELESIKSKNEIYLSKINELEAKFEDLTEQNFKLNRRINTHPLMPLLVLEDKVSEKPMTEHNCLCMICGKNLNQENNQYTEENKSQECKKDNENDINSNNEKTPEAKNDINSNIKEAKTNEAIEELTKEKEALRKRIGELQENMEEQSNEITEENILSSKQFQSLISQAENILTKLEKMREKNNNLQKENNNLNQKKEIEINQITTSFNEQIENCSQKLLDSSKIIEKNKTNIQVLLNKIESLENIIKEKEAFNINMIYDSFKKERENLLKKIEVIQAQKKDYLNKYEDECAKNQTNDLTICKLKNELNNLKLIIESNKIDEKKMLQYDLNKEAIKKEQSKVEIYKKENERVKYQLTIERKNYEISEEMNELSQNNITNLNSTIKYLKNKLDQEIEIQSKLSNDKTEAKQTINFYTELKETLEKKIEVYKEQIDKYGLYTKKMEDELNMQKQLNHFLEEDKKLIEEDIEVLKLKNIENLKIIDQERIMKEDLQNNLNELKNWKKKQLVDYEVLKAKYDDLCRYKQFDPNSINAEDVSKENEVLKLENQKLREMVHCKICKERMKDVVITKCFHTFCRECIDASIESRKRRCPICRVQISQNDVKRIFWD